MSKKSEMNKKVKSEYQEIQENELEKSPKLADHVEEAKMEAQRQRKNRVINDQILGRNKEMPGLLRCLSNVFDYQEDEPRVVKPRPFSVYPHLQLPKLVDVPRAPPGLEPMRKPPPQLLKVPKNLPDLVRQRLQQCAKLSQRLEPEKPLPTSRWPNSRELGLRNNLWGSNVLRQFSKPLARPMRSPSLQQNAARSALKPIIMVPSDLHSLVTLYNVQALLEDLRFVAPEDVKRSEDKLLDEVLIKRTHQGEQQEYRVMDNPAHLTCDDWEQVIAAFVHNPDTQFNGWPYGGDPLIISSRLCTFQLLYIGQPVFRDPNLPWLHTISVPEFERHTDQEILTELWQKLDEHLASSDRGMVVDRP